MKVRWMLAVALGVATALVIAKKQHVPSINPPSEIAAVSAPSSVTPVAPESLAGRVAELEQQLQQMRSHEQVPSTNVAAVREKVADQSGSDSRLLTDDALMAERQREYVQTTTAPMERQLRSEGIDQASTQRIGESLAQVLGDKATVVDLQCVASLCRMEIAAQQISSDEALRAVLMEGRYSEAFYHKQEIGGAPVTVLYVARDGGSLPRS